MNRLLARARQLLLGAVIALPGLLPTLAHATPTTYDAFLEGTGITVYNPSTGDGAWSGTLVDSPFPVPTLPLSLLTVVNFSFDSMSNLLTGDFEFTSAADFGSTLTGRVTGSFLFGDFETGGQLALDYDIQSGTGQFPRATGFLISLADISPLGGGFGSYSEFASGQFVVPAPGTLALAAVALLALGRGRRTGVVAECNR